MSVFLQIIQYTVITFGEIMFSITGYEFSYSQVIPPDDVNFRIF